MNVFSQGSFERIFFHPSINCIPLGYRDKKNPINPIPIPTTATITIQVFRQPKISINEFIIRGAIEKPKLMNRTYAPSAISRGREWPFRTTNGV